MGKIFLSYSAKDKSEVDRLDQELRRRGIRVWRDRRDLTGGRASEREIRAACREAAGFVFYLTQSAAESTWVREKERAFALARQQQWSGSGLIPIFRHDLDAITQTMQKLGTDANLDADLYDLRKFHGYVIDPTQDLSDELRRAADAVLASFLRNLKAVRPPGQAWTLGIVTRGGYRPGQYEPDLLLDWSQDFPHHGRPEGPGEPPLPGQWEESLWPALAGFSAHLAPLAGPSPFRVIPQCHLTLALAFGFSCGRNTGFELAVVEPHNDETWLGPATPQAPRDAWSATSIDVGAGTDLALAINITQPRESFERQVRQQTQHSHIGSLLILEPEGGPSKKALAGLGALDVHRRAVAAIHRLEDDPHYASCGYVHLFLASPPGFAILLAQQFSNLRPMQTYEWSVKRGAYSPGCLLVSS